MTNENIRSDQAKSNGVSRTTNPGQTDNQGPNKKNPLDTNRDAQSEKSGTDNRGDGLDAAREPKDPQTSGQAVSRQTGG